MLLAACVLAGGAHAAAATVTLELSTERAMQATALQEWLQLASGAGVATTRIRGAQAGDKTAIETTQTSAGVLYRVTGVLTARGELRLPGGVFTRRDGAKLRDYVARLKADGAEAMTAATGTFGLTKPQFDAVLKQLSRPTGFDASQPAAGQGATAAAFVQHVSERLAMRVVVDQAAAAALRGGPPLEPRIAGLSIGTALAVAAKQRGLIVVPVKPRGRPVELHLRVARRDARAAERQEDEESWPVGYEVKGPPRPVAPDLMQAINVEIDGFTLAEAVAAVTPRLKLPVLWDHDALASHRIDPAEVSVRLPRAKLSYKRILEKLLFQARLRGQLRTDEAGAPFFWISR
ncbi:MAG: hypothetical protein AAF790_07940 [Planctomycetota bacterium]